MPHNKSRESDCTIASRETIHTSDGRSIVATVYQSDGRLLVMNEETTVIVASAMGVSQTYYRSFASNIAGKLGRVITFDYRGIGQSQKAADHKTDLTAWGARDLDAIISWCEHAYPRSKLVFVGHSVGGQLLPFADRAVKIQAAFLVAAQSGYWRHWRGPWRYRVLTGWYAMPIVARAFGKLPYQFLGGGVDVPKGVALQWARWGRHRDYMLSQPHLRIRERFASLTIPMSIVSIKDDPMAPERSVDVLADYYSMAKIDRVIIDPADVGHPIGHFGFFRSKNQDLWKAVCDYLR